MRATTIFFAASLLVSLPSRGLEPYLVKDINPVAIATGSSPSSFVSLGAAAVFTATDGETGLGLWRSDGTPAGTLKLADLCPLWSSCGTVRPLAVAEGRAFLALDRDLWVTDGTVAGTRLLTDDLVAIGGEAAWVPEQRALYFTAADREHGVELWRSDGTPDGTRLVADLLPGAGSSSVRTLTTFRGQVWFATRIGTVGAVWRSDGTAGGTVAVQQSDGPGLPTLHGVVAGRLLFSGLSGPRGPALWATDGTSAGTAPVLRLRSGIRDAVVQNNRLFFVAVNPGHGQELWVSDGTPRGSRVLTDIPGTDAFSNRSLPRTSLPGRFFFQAADPDHGVELWVSDGTPAGTRRLRDVCPGPCSGVDVVLMSNQGLFYFAGTNNARGMELWASDGTPAGTRMVRDLCPGPCSSVPSFPNRFAGRLLFMASDEMNEEELWTTDGTAAGTVPITRFAPSVPIYDPQGTVIASEPARFVFAADGDGTGPELWSLGGSAAGATLVADINQADVGGAVISGLRALGDQAFFFADDGVHGYELWKSDGSPAGTALVADLVPGIEPYYIPELLASTESGGALYLSVLNSDGYSLWRTDGTAAGTLRLRRYDTPVLWAGSMLRGAGGRVYFLIQDADFGPQLWVTDGTVDGARPIINPGPAQLFHGASNLTEMGGKLYFFAIDPSGVYGLWSSDGTAAGTVKIKAFGAGFETLTLPTLHAGRLWFSASVEPGHVELWSSDGTEAGTRVEPLPGLPRASFMASLGDTLMISGFGGSGFELWATDGTPAGTRKVGPNRDVAVPFTASTVFQSRLIYTVDERVDGHPELWASDGTIAGTGPLLDRDGHCIPAALDFATLGDRLYFTTETPAQVWVTDGTPAGTSPIALMRPVGGSPGAVGRAGNRVFFGAWNAEIGQELWAVGPSAP